MLLLAAAIETGLLAQFSQALPKDAIQPHVSHLSNGLSTDHRLLLTLLFLGAVGLRRTWDLRGYMGDGLALLTGRKRAYGYRYTEEFLVRIAETSGAEHLTDALANWTAHLWHIQDTNKEIFPSAFYVDGHRKPVYTDVLIPRGLVGRLGSILGCRALVLLHDAQGHPLLATTYRGDLHLTKGLPAIIERYERATDTFRLERVIVDREGMSTEFLATLQAMGRTVVTVLRTDQYRDLTSFTDVGDFVPLSVDRQNTVVREVAPASITLPLPEHPGETLPLRVALIRDLRRHVAAPLSQEDKDLPMRWDADLIDALELAHTYIHRWPAQENVIKDFLLPLGLEKS